MPDLPHCIQQHIASAVLATAIPSIRQSVRLSVCHTPVLCQNELAPNRFGASSEPASVMEFGFNWTAPWPHPFFIHHLTHGFRHVADACSVTSVKQHGQQICMVNDRYPEQVSAVADEPARRAASRQTCCKHRWTLTVINLQPN